MIPSRIPYGSNSYFHLPRWRISIYPRNLRQVSRPPCKSSLVPEYQKCCPACRISTWRGPSHSSWELYRKTLGSSLPRDSFPVTLLPFLSGTACPERGRGGIRGRGNPICHVCSLPYHLSDAKL